MAVIPLRVPASLADDPAVLTGLVFLEGSRYRLTLRWSPRADDDGLWHLDVLDGAGTACVLGVPLVTSEDVLAPYHYEARNLPPGKLRVTTDPDPVTGARRDPGLRDLGVSSRLEYVESTDT